MRRIVGLLLLLLLLTACGGAFGAGGEIVEVPVTVEIPVTVEVTVMPPPMPVTSTIEPTAEMQPMPVVYYYFPSDPSGNFPAGSVAVLPDSLILSPTISDFVRSGDPATDIFLRLQLAINDSRNPWTGQNLQIDHVSYTAGQATVLLSGEMFGVGDIVLIAARWQLLLTIFADEAVQSAVVIINGNSIANLGISNSSQAQPADHQFTRAEIEIFMGNNAIN